jgi:hypothetical protein
LISHGARVAACPGSAWRPTPTDPRMPPMAKLVDVGSIGSYRLSGNTRSS